MEPILFYEGKWYFFSNFSAFAVYWFGQDWMTAEHAYQAAKFGTDDNMQKLIRGARSAHDAKKIGRFNQESVRSDWAEVKLIIMEEILRAKLSQHPFIQEKLLGSANSLIIEDSPKDSFWGRGYDHKGQNHLGKIWMKLREELRRKKS